jgi:hypothetical protein
MRGIGAGGVVSTTASDGKSDLEIENLRSKKHTTASVWLGLILS